MNEKQLKEFLAVDSVDGLIKENKLLTILYVIFTILFVDVHFFVTELFKVNAILVFLIMIVMTTFIIPLVILNIISKKLSVFQLFVIQGMNSILIAAIWFCILLVKNNCNYIELNKWHIVTVSIMMLLLLCAIVFRVYKLYNYSSKKKKTILYTGIFTMGMGITFILRQILSRLGKEITNTILEHGLIVLCGIFLIVSSMAFLNALVVKKYRFIVHK